MYEMNRLYVWRNQAGYMAQYNGVVCRVTGPCVTVRCVFSGRTTRAWPTDSPSRVAGAIVYAEAGDLRPIDPPPGERMVLDQFKAAAIAADERQLQHPNYRSVIYAPIISLKGPR